VSVVILVTAALPEATGAPEPASEGAGRGDMYLKSNRSAHSAAPSGVRSSG
jgi:hypothetical protein